MAVPTTSTHLQNTVVTRRRYCPPNRMFVSLLNVLMNNLVYAQPRRKTARVQLTCCIRAADTQANTRLHARQAGAVRCTLSDGSCGSYLCEHFVAERCVLKRPTAHTIDCGAT